MTAELIELGLFDLVVGYAADVAAGKVKPAKALKQTSALVTFCDNFFLQFFENVVGHEITGFDATNKLEVSRLRVKQRRADGVGSTGKLLRWFERFCDDRIDIIGAGYGSSTHLFKRFHTYYVDGLLTRICEWANADGHEAIAQRAETARGQLQAAIEAQQW